MTVPDFLQFFDDSCTLAFGIRAGRTAPLNLLPGPFSWLLSRAILSLYGGAVPGEGVEVYSTVGICYPRRMIEREQLAEDHWAKSRRLASVAHWQPSDKFPPTELSPARLARA